MEFTCIIHHHEYSLAACRAHVVLQRHRSVIGIYYIARLPSKFGNPACELAWISNSSTKEDVLNIRRQHYYGLFPYHSSLFVSHIMNLIKNNPFRLSHYLTTSINHIPQNFSSHNKTGCILIYAGVACH